MHGQSRMIPIVVLFCCTAGLAPLTARAAPPYDVIIRGGLVYDGTGNAPYQADVGIKGDTLVQIGQLEDAAATEQIDADGLAVAPGFINMLSWATSSLIADGRSQSDIRQGVTLEIFGEGFSYGPLNKSMRRDLMEGQGDIKFEVPWTTLSEYLEHLADRGVSANVASFVGATTIRVHVLGYEDRQPTKKELQRMRELVRQEMENGARRRFVADLRPGVLRRDSRADRDVQGGRGVRRNLHFAPS